MATQSGVCQAVFLEGGLSRDGRLGQPRLGFLDYILRRYDWHNDRNIVFIPAGINYDRVLEDRNLLRWDDKSSRDSKWQSVSKLWQFLRLNLFAGSRARWQRYGYASVNFGIPVSMREYCQQHDVDFDRLDKDRRIERVTRLAGTLMEALRYVIPILPVSVVATVMLEAEDDALTVPEICQRCDTLVDQIMARGAPMRQNEKPRHRTLINTLQLLSDRGVLIKTEDHFQVDAAQREILAYYARSIEHWCQ
jgi:glycerol-3-phosphate O-acyltransferase